MKTKQISRGIAAFMQRNVMLPDEQFDAAYEAWLSCRVADRPDHRYDITQAIAPSEFGAVCRDVRRAELTRR